MTHKEHRRLSEFDVPGLFPAHAKQSERIAERKQTEDRRVTVSGVEFVVMRGVYQTSVDTELMAGVVNPRANETLLEVGCGCGAVTLLSAQRCLQAVGVDINPLAVANSLTNAAWLGITNVTFRVSDVFEKVTGKFDIVVCNPPYNECSAGDEIEQMFWDPQNSMKRRFFEKVRDYLTDSGQVYFGWADFADLDVRAPLRLAERAGLSYVSHYSKLSTSGEQRFYVIKFEPVS